MSTGPPRRAPAIVWFRKDLRVADNPALVAAAQTGGPVIPVYIHDEEGPPRRAGAASRWWLDKSLTALAGSLATLGAPLILRRGDCLDALRRLIGETGAGSVYWNRLYDQPSIRRDANVQAALAKAGVETRTSNAALLNEPWSVAPSTGGSYRVFTPYWRAARATAGEAPCHPAPLGLHGPTHPTRSDALGEWNLHPARPDWSLGFGDWRPGEDGARERLDRFLAGAARDYCAGRDRPGADGTSRLSPHLHFGEIGPRQVWAAAEAAAGHGAVPHGQIETFQKELGWREFNYHLLYHHPEIPTEDFNSTFGALDWRDDAAGLEAWRRGRTGYPMVDAAMRQLWSTGWMHNRARMIVASFLVKDLLIDWRQGEAWFWDTLVDADLANNVANWQWVAGSGADAAPWFRVFNPTLQGEKFDARGDYVRRFAPELAGLPDALVHQPCRADEAALATAGVCLAIDYPRPIVDHAAARARALAAYKRLA